ncbi:MAG: MFS transporter [Deltaproteobacteria bacterium]|nr:MFS transporter [Deltaproteobacteria bacterium]
MISIPGANQNFYAFIWHALFLAFVSTFVDVNTVLSSFILRIGGSSIHVGMITAISIGLPMITQLLFAGFLSGQPLKKPFLLMGIYIRVFALAGMGYTLTISDSSDHMRLLVMVFLWIGIFSLSGAFAEISYTDILGKVLPRSQRKRFLIFKQLISSTGMLVSSIVASRLVIRLPYPLNYTMLFFMAALLLFIAAFGFLMIKEDTGYVSNYSGIIHIIRSIPRLIKSESNLINFIILVNLTSLGITIIPFYVVFSKSIFGLTNNQIGNYLFLLFLGMIISTFFWGLVSNRFRYKGVSFGCIVTGGLLPITVLLVSRFGMGVYQWIFFLAGFSISAAKISYQGILLEITNNDNRAIFTGIVGTLSLTTALFPLMAGVLIKHFGFNVVFTIISPLIITAIFFLRRIRCSASEVSTKASAAGQ